MEDNLKIELLKDMKVNSWKYHSLRLRLFFDGIGDYERSALEGINSDEIDVKFLLSGETLTYEELIANHIITDAISKEQLLACDIGSPETNSCMLEEAQDEVDVLLIGDARSGKSMVAASVMERLWHDGVASVVPSDVSRGIFLSSLSSIHSHKFLTSTDNDAISVVKYQFYKYHDFRLVSHGDKFRYNSTFDNYYLRNFNRKIVLFLIDPFLKSDRVLEKTNDIWLNNIVEMMSYNGDERNGKKNCIMSRVDGVVLLFTKFDLIKQDIGQTAEEWMDNYIQNYMRFSYLSLCKICHCYGINKANDYKPYIMKFSVGDTYIGNTFVYNPTDAKNLTNLLFSLIPKKRFWKRIFH